MKIKMKLKYNYLIPIIVVIILILLFFSYSNTYTFTRTIKINTMFLVYDLYALFGVYWQFVPQYCSPMTTGFTPILPLKYYAEFNKAIFPRISSGNNTLNKEEVIQICDRNLEWLLKNKEICHSPTRIEVIYVNTPNFKEKVMNYIKKDFPFVIRGIDLKCFTTMRFNQLMKIAGHKKVYMSPSPEETCPDNIFTELRNITENKCYITNSTNLFYHYEELLPDSDMETIKEIIGGYMKNDSKQLFLGVVKGTGTALHAAYTNNFFIMIQGEKKWTFFNPNQLALLYPNFQKKGIYMASQSRFLNMDTDTFLDKFPLIKYAERYEVELQERDVLYNPMSWFHSVYNKTDISVACSTRWSKDFILPDSHLLRYGNLTNPELRDYVKEIYVNTGVLGISQIDEHKHLIGENDPDSVPYWDKYTNDSHKVCSDEDCSMYWHNKR